MSEIKMSKEGIEIKFPGTKPLNVDKVTAKVVKDYTKIAEENVKKSNEIQNNALPPIVSEKVKNKIINTFKAVLAAGMVGGIAVPLAACKGTPVEVEEKATPSSETKEATSSMTAVETTSQNTETTSETTTEVIMDWKFHKDNSTFTNKEGETIAILVEKAYKQGGEWKSGVGLNTEGLKAVSEENKKKGLPTIVWPFDFKENNNIEIVELASANEDYKYIGIKYAEPINLYAASDCVLGYKFKYIPQKNDSFSSQDFSGSYFSTGFEVKNKNGDMVSLDYEIEVVDWKPLVTLSQPWLSGRWEIQHFLEEVKIGQLIGQLLPANPNYSFLDFRNRPDWYENPDYCQASLWMNIFGDRLDVKSDLDRILRSGEKDKGITFFVWSNNQKTAHEQTK